jgi:drug/metabolite transporter (DMT)-like permease
MALTIAGTILAALEKPRPGERARLSRGVGLGMAAAVAFGIFFVLMDPASEADPFWASFLMRASYTALLVPLHLMVRPNLAEARFHWPSLAFMGTVDALASFSFAYALSIGMLSLVAVVSEFYPAVTIILSMVVLRERPRAVQLAGIALAIAGILMISHG